MDLKSTGMNWVASLRQKFDTVYNEVDAKLSQNFDSQVQTVGVNVNKFLSELMPDLFSSSCTDSNQEKVSGPAVVENVNAISEEHIIRKIFNDSAEISPIGKDSFQSSNSSEDGNCLNVKDFIPPGYSIRSTGSITTLEKNVIHEISNPTTDEDESVKNEKHAPHQSESRETSYVGKKSCPLSNSSEDGDSHDLNDYMTPSFLNSLRSAVNTLEENIIHEISKPTTLDVNSVKNEKLTPHWSEEAVLQRKEASLSSTLQNTLHLEPEASWEPAEGAVFNFYVEEDNENLIHKQSRIEQDENTAYAEPPPLEASAVLSALNDMSASSFFSELSYLGHERESGCIDLQMKILRTRSMELTHESSPQPGLVHDDVTDANNCWYDVSSSLSSYDLNPTVVPDEDLESGPLPFSSYPTESKGCSDVNGVESCNKDVEVFNDVNLEDSCIVVENKDLLMYQRSSNRKSFKKKLQHALVARLRPSKQREYEQLATLYSDIDADTSLRRERESSASYIPVQDLQSENLAADDLSESESESDWELV